MITDVYSEDGGRSFHAASPAGPFPLLPTSTCAPRRTQTPGNFSSLNAFKCTNRSCTGQLVRWRASPGAHLNITAYIPLRVSGVTPQLVSARSGERPIKLRDGSVLMATYGYASDSSRVCSKDMKDHRCYTVFLFAAPDADTDPTAWEYISRIDHTPVLIHNSRIFNGKHDKKHEFEFTSGFLECFD